MDKREQSVTNSPPSSETGNTLIELFNSASKFWKSYKAKSSLENITIGNNSLQNNDKGSTVSVTIPVEEKENFSGNLAQTPLKNSS